MGQRGRHLFRQGEPGSLPVSYTVVLDIPITDIANGATMIVPAKYKVGIADCCSIFITVSDTPVVGNKIFVNNTTGAITNAAQGLNGIRRNGNVVQD